MQRFKKLFYTAAVLCIILVLALVVAGNSSYIIKKAADRFAPDYKISYRDIRGNVLTGITIRDLKFDGHLLAGSVGFGWDPSRLLYRTLKINKVILDDVNLSAIKALTASLPASEEENETSSGEFPLTLKVAKIHLSLLPFTEEGIAFDRAVLDLKALSFASDEVSTEGVVLQADTNLTKLYLSASLEDGILDIHSLGLKEIDTVAIQKRVLASESGSAGQDGEGESAADVGDVKPNPLIPAEILLEHAEFSLLPRLYRDIRLDTLTLDIKGARADIGRLMKGLPGGIAVEALESRLESNVSKVVLKAGWKGDTVEIRELDAERIDTVALQRSFAPSADQNSSRESEERPVASESEHSSPYLPAFVRIDRLHLGLMPAVIMPVHLHALDLNISDTLFDTKALVAKHGRVHLLGQTNLSHIVYDGKVQENRIKGKIALTPNQPLFDLYDLPLRKEAIGTITIDLDASEERVIADLHAKAKHILLLPSEEGNATDAAKPFNVNVNLIKSHLVFNPRKERLLAESELHIETPYTPEVTLTNRFSMDGGVAYEGVLHIPKITGADKNLTALLQDLKVVYNGTDSRLESSIDAKALTGALTSADMQKAFFRLKTKGMLPIGEMFALPETLHEAEAGLSLSVPINLKQISPLHADINLTSNVVHMDADLLYDRNVTLSTRTTIPDDSLLQEIDRHIVWDALMPLQMDAKLDRERLSLEATSGKLAADVALGTGDGTVEGSVTLAGMLVTLQGNMKEDIVIKSNIDSFNTLMDTVSQFYKAEEMPKINGKLDLSLSIHQGREAVLALSSPAVVYHPDRLTEHEIDDLRIALMKKGPKVVLSSYHLLYNGMELFATKPSEIVMEEANLTIPQLWLNDQLKVSGALNTKMMQGEIVANAPTFHLSHELIDLDTMVDVKTLFDGNQTDVKGRLTLQGGNIHYDLDTKTFPSDSDILIVQELQKDAQSPFMDNLTMLINVDTQKPLVYREGPVNVKATVDLGVHKAVHSDPLVIGSIDIVDGSSYLFQGKRFVLERSHIYLTGDPSKPMLDLTVKYKALKHEITIVVTGTPSAPNVFFSSIPNLNKEQILSLILFDSEEAAGTNDANDMMKMMGGAMAKSALNDLGVKIDHLVIGEGNSVEVGKKLTDNTTVIYINGEIPQMQVKYEYSPTIEVVVGASEKSESLDVVYRRDFKTDDIVIKGR
ncbi:MAG: translocation/assembly module TamB domain-containing protein [Deltaproteobacteria bacterium]|nr:translocation/assembly module TamB domain-containing protein [Deltaproteobacteria bacterium]